MDKSSKKWYTFTVKRFFPNSFRSIPRAYSRLTGRVTPASKSQPKFTLGAKEKKQFVAGGLDLYRQSYQKEMRRLAEAVGRGEHINDKEVAFFAQQLKADRRLTSKEDIQRFAQGFLKEAHTAGMKLRSGYNPPGHEYEQAQKMVGQAKAKFAAEHAPPPPPAEPRPIDTIRARAHDQYPLRSTMSPTMPTMTEPTPLPPSPAGWTKGQTEPGPAAPPKTPHLSPLRGGFTYGHSTRPHDRPDEAVGGIVPSPPPTAEGQSGIAPKEDNPSLPEPQLPDTSHVDEGLPF